MLKPIGFILRFFLLLIYSAVLRIQFLGPFINLMFKLLANSLNFINRSINSILVSSFILCIIRFNSIGPIYNDSSLLIIYHHNHFWDTNRFTYAFFYFVHYFCYDCHYIWMTNKDDIFYLKKGYKGVVRDPS